MVGLILIYKEDFFKVKIEIYYQTIRIITKCKSKCHILHKVIQPNITALEKAAIESLLMMYANENMQKCHPIIADMSVDYKEQEVIIDIKSNIQCLMCQVPPNKRENLCKKWPKGTNECMLSQLAL